MHDHTQVQHSPVGRRLADGRSALPFAERLPLHVRMEDVGRFGRGVGIEGHDVVRRGLSETVDLHEDLEPAELDSFEHDRRGDDGKSSIPKIDREAVELRLQNRQIIQDLADRRHGPSIPQPVEVALTRLQMMDDGANQRGMLSPQAGQTRRPIANATHFQPALNAEQPLPVAFRKGSGRAHTGLFDLPDNAARQPEPLTKRRGLRRIH